MGSRGLSVHIGFVGSSKGCSRSKVGHHFLLRVDLELLETRPDDVTFLVFSNRERRSFRSWYVRVGGGEEVEEILETDLRGGKKEISQTFLANEALDMVTHNTDLVVKLYETIGSFEPEVPFPSGQPLELSTPTEDLRDGSWNETCRRSDVER